MWQVEIQKSSYIMYELIQHLGVFEHEGVIQLNSTELRNKKGRTWEENEFFKSQLQHCSHTNLCPSHRINRNRQNSLDLYLSDKESSQRKSTHTLMPLM